MLPTVGCLVAQFNTVQQPFMAFDIVPKAVINQKTELTFNFQSVKKKAVIRIPDLISSLVGS